MFVMVVVIVIWNVIRSEVLFISFLFFSKCIICLGSFIWFVIVLIVIIFVGDKIVVSVNVVGNGMEGIS